MEPPESSQRLTWVTCCTVGAIVGLSAMPLVLLLPAAYTRPLIRPLLAFVALSVTLIVGSWLWDHRGGVGGAARSADHGAPVTPCCAMAVDHPQV